MRPWLVLFAIVAGATVAHGNGRFPQTISLAFQPGDEQKIWVGSTFGLLHSPDDGEHWYWVCEQALGYQGIHDPIFGVTSTGTIFETVYDGLRISRDGGCTFTLAGNGLDGIWISDLQLGADGAVWVSTRTNAGPNDVYVSRDDGVTFTSTGLLRPRAFWTTMRVAPSDPNRLYVTGYQMTEPVDAPGAPTPLLYRTDDSAGPLGWLEIPFAFGGEAQLKLLGVSRVDPDLVFVRIDDEPTDTVYRSEDAGVSFTQILEFTKDDATSFLSFADGMTIVIGSAYAGAKISRDAGVSWADLPGAPQMIGAGIQPGEEVFATGANWEPDMMALGRSTDLATWTKVFRFVELDGPLACPDGTPQASECGPIWCNTCDMFGCPDPACGSPPDAAPRDGGFGGGGGGNGNCGCTLGRAATALGPAILAVAALALVRGGRGRRRGEPR